MIGGGGWAGAPGEAAWITHARAVWPTPARRSRSNELRRFHEQVRQPLGGAVRGHMALEHRRVVVHHAPTVAAPGSVRTGRLRGRVAFRAEWEAIKRVPRTKL